MLKTITVTLCALATLALPAAAQKWEFGAGAAGGFYASNNVAQGQANASAGFSSGVAATGFIGQNVGRLFGGEVHYTYGRNNLKLSSGNDRATFGAQSHAVYYDFLVHTAPPDARVRPFAAVGGGMKIYQGTGAEVVYQALSNFALLTKTRDFRPLLTAGGGVKYALSERFLLRVEFRDFITPFPKKVIAPNAGAKVSGWVHNFVPMVGLSFLM